jgi:hypothetical protein
VLSGDLAVKAELRRVAEQFTARHPALHLLVNNAAAYHRTTTVDADGIELNVVVNYLAGATLSMLLLDALRAGAPARVVNVVTAAMGDTRHFKFGRRVGRGDRSLFRPRNRAEITTRVLRPRTSGTTLGRQHRDKLLVVRSYDVSAISKAPSSVVWRLLLDARSWPVWSTVDSLEVERSSGLDPDGRDAVGAVRAFRTGRMVTGERLTGTDEEKRLTYEDAFNPVLHDYRAVIELTPTEEGGTSIRWRGDYATRWYMGWLMDRTMKRVMQQMADGLASYAATAGEP